MNLRIGFRNFGKSIVLTINSFMDQLNSNGVLFLIGKYLSAGIIPVFTTIRTLTNTLTMLTNLIVQPLIPEIIRYDSEGKKEKIWKIIEVNWLISGSIISIAFLVLIPIIELLFAIWTKGLISYNKAIFYLLALSVLAVNFGRAMTSYLAGINDLRHISIISAVRFILLFGVALLFLQKFNLVAIGMGVLASEIVCSIILPAWFVHRHLHNYQYDLSKLFLASVPVMILGVTLLLCYFLPNATLALCSITAVVLLVVYLRLWNRIEVQIRTRLVNYLRNGIRRVYSA